MLRLRPKASLRRLADRLGADPERVGPVNRFIGGYNSSGQRIFELQLPYGFFYRAFPVPSGEITADQLRHGMNAMAH